MAHDRALYCHPLDQWPEAAEIVERYPSAAARGAAQRSTSAGPRRNNRSQIVFTEPNPGRAGGRPMIFWQTARTARRARPGQRVPTRRASQLEQLRSRSTRASATLQVRRPPRRHASARARDRRLRRPRRRRLIAAVERKTPEDFTKSLIDGSLNYALAELAALPTAAVVVEERYGALLNDQHAQPGWLLELVARLQVRYPAVPIVFADSRKLAEEYTYRYLAAALVHHTPADAPPADGSA